ncbi:MAG: hypothetical protein ACMG6E_09005 [Candidatus Roizmanbacteria bacterium]
MDLEDSPVLAWLEVSGSFRLFEVVAGHNQEKVEPESNEELDGPQPHVTSEVAEEELGQ